MRGFFSWTAVIALVAAVQIQCVLAAFEAIHLTRNRDDQYIFGNNFVQAVFNFQTNELVGLYGDFQGGGNFSVNCLSKSFQLNIGGSPRANGAAPIKILTTTADVSTTKDSVRVLNKVVRDDVEEEWTFTVQENSRVVDLRIVGTAVADITATYLSYGVYLNAPSLYGLFESGVVQMMGHSAACLGSEDALSRAYFLGDGSALDVVVLSANQTKTAVFRSDSSGKESFKSALELQVAGATYPQLSKSYYGAWSSRCWSDAAATRVPQHTSWTLDLQFLPNNGNFPVHSVRDVLDGANMGDATQVATHLLGVYPSAVGCLQSYYDKQRGIVAPTVSHPDVGYSPDTNFFDPDNFLTLSALLYAADPLLLREARDVVERTAQTMCGLGNDQDARYCDLPRQRLHARHQPYRLQRHSKGVNSGVNSGVNGVAGGRAGQLMHHFVSLAPTYESIAGSEQLGPNVFWTLLALRYVSLTQDAAWALRYFPFVDLSVQFVLSFVDRERRLVDAPGPLWIDVLVRENFTSDSSAMLVSALPQLADFYDLVAHLNSSNNDNNSSNNDSVSLKEAAEEMRGLARDMSAAMATQLWATAAAGDDHFVTQLNRDGSVRDFVDYDANLLAVAAGVLSDGDANGDGDGNSDGNSRLKRLMRRVDSGNFTHVRATWCSERPYSGERCDCYIVGGSVCGDSVVTLARIGWVDALARHRVGDADTYARLLLRPLQTDLLRDTWLSERYDSTGAQVRTPFYFEYPALVTMLLREVSVGLSVGPLAVEVRPIDAASRLLYRVGAAADGLQVSVDYRQAPEAVALRLPGVCPSACWPRRVSLHHLAPLADYLVETQPLQQQQQQVSETQQLRTDARGVLRFSATFSAQTELRVRRL